MKPAIVLFFLIASPISLFSQATDEKEWLDSVEITPNPYYGNVNNKTLYPGYIDIKKLPSSAGEITIYQLGGEKVRTLVKKEGETNLLWFLRTEKNEPIQTGVYLIFVKIDGYEDTILRFAYKAKFEYRDPF